jgi:hypothetical protein
MTDPLSDAVAALRGAVEISVRLLAVRSAAN